MNATRWNSIKELHDEFERMGMQCDDWGIMAHEHRAHLIEYVEELRDNIARWIRQYPVPSAATLQSAEDLMSFTAQRASTTVIK